MHIARAYYNEIDPYCVEWLYNLMWADLIPGGYVDTRPIQQIQPEDLDGFDQYHFFAGIGGWAYALRLAGWDERRPVWTGSCPCQPFSVAGQRRGTSDERHLWPFFANLISKCSPSIVFGEQVASADGRVWLAGVQTDLEALGFAVGAADLCAAGVGAPHIRQRLWWVADAGYRKGRYKESRQSRCDAQRDVEHDATERCCEDGSARESRGPWSDFDWIECLDGKQRRVESGTFPLAHGVPARMGKLCAYGNAIVPQVAAEFVRAYLDI